MNASTNSDEKMVFPVVVSKKILYDKGSEWATVWFEDFTKIIRMLPESLFKKEMVSVLDEGKVPGRPLWRCQHFRLVDIQTDHRSAFCGFDQGCMIRDPQVALEPDDGGWHRICFATGEGVDSMVFIPPTELGIGTKNTARGGGP